MKGVISILPRLYSLCRATIKLMPSEPTENEAVAVGSTRRASWYLQAATLLFIGMLIVLNGFSQPSRAYLTTRSVTLSSALPGATTSHAFLFDMLGTPSVGSMSFEYCSNSALHGDICTAPAGLDVMGASLSAQSGEVGFTLDGTTTANRLVLTRPSQVATTGTKQYTFASVVNPSSVAATTYVRISTYPTPDATGPYNDYGSVTFSIQSALTVSVYVPPFLELCAGVTVAADCSTTVGTMVDIGELSKVSANTATTQFALATNSVNGYSASVQGSTMTAGNRVIPALALPSLSIPGTGQFGINLRANTAPSVGTDISGTGSGSVAAGYATPNVFRFQNGDIVATSPISTEYNRYTISYLVNIPTNQAAGRYASTITVIATTTF